MRIESGSAAFLVSAVALVLSWMSGVSAPAAEQQVAVERDVSVVQVNVTNQAYDFFRPWGKKAPYTRRGLGALLQGGRVLVTSELVANANYVELERVESGKKVGATVEVVDYEANLAVLRPDDPGILEGLKPLELTDSVVGDEASVLQVESTGALLVTPALLKTVEVSRYPVDDTSLLVYRMTSSLQYREGSFTVPVLRDGKLTGLLMRFDARSQNVDVIPKPVIEHFLAAAEKKPYQGFPRAGISFAAMRDPQLRRYAGLSDDSEGGVYVTQVDPGGAAEKAGMKPGDVILEIGGTVIDRDGNYLDPVYGEVSIVNLISTKYFTGDTVPFKIHRDEGNRTLDVKLEYREAEDYIIPPYLIGRAPNYHVVGGLVLQELSRQYLKEWGSEWQQKAPQRFVYYDQYQSNLFDHDRDKLVILSQIIPTLSTVGYENVGPSVVTAINGRKLNNLSDVTEAIQNPIDGFHKIELEEAPKVLYLDVQQAAADDDALVNRYGLPALKRLRSEE